MEPGEILLGVRPEHIYLTERRENSIPCTLEVNEMMGAEMHLHVRVDDDTVMILRVPTTSLSEETKASLTDGARLHVTFSGDLMHFFDKETQLNLLY